VDFTRDSLRDRLRQAGFDFAAPAFVSWLGTTMYLQESAIGQTLAVTGGFAPADLSRIAHAQIPGGPAMDGTLARLRNRLRVSRAIAEIAARHLPPPAT